MQSFRYQLHLLRLNPLRLGTETGSITPYFDFEGEIYGIYSKWRDYQRIVLRGHSIRGMVLDGDGDGDGVGDGDGDGDGDGLDTVQSFPFVESVHIPYYSIKTVISSNRFPRLTKIKVDMAPNTMITEEFMVGVWDLPLTSLSINNGLRRVIPFPSTTSFSFNKNLVEYGPPAFAHTLRVLCTDTLPVLDLLVRYCQSLQRLDIYCDHVHEIIAHNATTLTSLTMWLGSEDIIDLSQYYQLETFSLDRGSCGFCFSSNALPNIRDITLYPHYTMNPDQARSFQQFIGQCPGLQNLSLQCDDWQQNIDITSAVVDPSKCKLTINSLFFEHSFDEAEKGIFSRGFEAIDGEFLLHLRDSAENWARIFQLSPHIKQWTGLRVVRWRNDQAWCDTLYQRNTNPLLLTYFHQLSQLELDLTWHEQLFDDIVRSCPMLKILHLIFEREIGPIVIHSDSLRVLELVMDSVPSINLKLCNLTCLSFYLSQGEGTFLQSLLNGDSLIQLPVLRRLCITHSFETRCEYPVTVSCTVGHKSLTSLEIQGREDNPLGISNLTLQNLPCLRQVTLTPLPLDIQVLFRVPGNCDINLSCWRMPGASSSFIRHGCLDPKMEFYKKLCYDSGWVDPEEKEKRRQEKEREEKKKKREQEEREWKRWRKGKLNGHGKGKGKGRIKVLAYRWNSFLSPNLRIDWTDISMS